jgi:hypothetical protein
MNRPIATRTELEVFPVAEKQQKSGPNSPAQHHSYTFQPALKPILERFDFVKLSRFNGWGTSRISVVSEPGAGTRIELEFS